MQGLDMNPVEGAGSGAHPSRPSIVSGAWLLELAASLPIVTQTEVLDLAEAGEALARPAAGDIHGAAVLEVSR
jgi:hypothetical protein